MFIIVISFCYVEDYINIICPSLSLVIFLDLRSILSHLEKAMAPHSSTLFIILFYFLTLQYCIGFTIYQHDSAMRQQKRH